MTMQRWEPFADLRRLDDRLARLWGRWPLSGGIMPGDDERWTVPLDIREEGDNLVVEASIPGMKADEIDVEFEDGILTIQGQTKSEREEKRDNYLLKERSAGAFYRSVRLPETVNGDQAKSTYKDGVLTISMPKKAEAKAKKVPVSTQ